MPSGPQNESDRASRIEGSRSTVELTAPECKQGRPRGRPKVKPDEEQISEIVAVARKLFIAQGYAGTTMDDIAAGCRISKRTLYRLFPSKLEVFAGIVRDNRPAMLALPADYHDLPVAEALERIFRVDLDLEAEKQRLEIVRIIVVEGTKHPELMEIGKREGGDLSRADLAAWLRTRTQSGELEIDDADAHAHILMDMIFGIFVVRSAPSYEPLIGTERVQHVRRCIKIFLKGVQAPVENKVRRLG